MNSVQFLESILDWLLADPAHIVVAASIVAALTPTPDPASLAGKLYRVVDLLALNILRAKQIGAPASPGPVAPDAAANPGANAPGKPAQAGFSRLSAAVLIVALGASFGLAGCSGVQSVAVSANAQAVHTAAALGRDQLALSREMLCGAPYQVLADAMAADPALAGAVPGLCPAMKSVPAAPAPAQPVAAN